MRMHAYLCVVIAMDGCACKWTNPNWSIEVHIYKHKTTSLDECMVNATRTTHYIRATKYTLYIR